MKIILDYQCKKRWANINISKSKIKLIEEANDLLLCDMDVILKKNSF